MECFAMFHLHGCYIRIVFIVVCGFLLSEATLGNGPSGSQPSIQPAILADFNARVIGTAPAVGRNMAGRNAVTYEHPCLTEWGYAPNAENRKFVVVEPSRQAGPPPLLVYLHAAGGKAAGYAPKYGAMDKEFVLLSVECPDANGPEGWYGWNWAQKDLKAYADTYSPPEQRILATVEWVARKYAVDRNRIYMYGHSMGGSGTLGLGMARGDIFAAIWVGVPAHVDHLWFRMGFPELVAVAGSSPTIPVRQVSHPADYLRQISGVGRPDAPPLIDISSPTDMWSLNQECLVQAAQDGRHLMVFDWEPFGHTQIYDSANPAVLEFPWLQIRKDQAYPVFTHASTDGKYPGMRPKGDKEAGQINAYFRWESISDTPAALSMRLWLVDGKSLNTPIDSPASALVDLTPRRLQAFQITAGHTYRWRLTEADRVIASGSAVADEVGLLTVRQLEITRQRRKLVLERQ